MNLIWHIFRKDLRRLAMPLVLWGAVIELQFIAWLFARGLERAESHAAEKAVMLLWGLHLAVAWLLVPLLIHDDPPIGDRAAWRTRPISGGRLLAAKLLGVALMFCLWPSVLTVPWWWQFGFGPGEIVRAIAVNALGMALFTGAALMVAVLTDTIARFFAWSLVLGAGASLGGLMVVAGMPAASDGPVSAAVLITRASLAFGVIFAAAVVVVPLQFLRRRTGVARGIAMGAILLSAVLVLAWPWSMAQMLAGTGIRKFSLPNVSARVANATLVVPADPSRQPASVRVTTEFALKGIAATEVLDWKEADPVWNIGGGQGPDLLVVSERRGFGAITRAMANAVVRGDSARRDRQDYSAWSMTLPGARVPSLRDGAAVLSARNRGAIWRGELGPVVAVRAGAGAARGFQQLHVSGLKPRSLVFGGESDAVERPSVHWLVTELLLTPTVVLELMNSDGMERHRYRAALLQSGGAQVVDDRPYRYFNEKNNYLQGFRIPVGVLGVTEWFSDFDRRWWTETENGLVPADRVPAELPLEGATLASIDVEEVAPLSVALADTPFLPDLVVEGRLDDALRRAKAEDKLVLARTRGVADEPLPIPAAWNAAAVRELLVTRFVCVQVSNDEAVRLRKTFDEAGVGVTVILRQNGEELDRLRDLSAAELLAALRANGEGRTYAAALAERLAATGTEDRTLRFRLHEALRARGELRGAFDAILSIMEHPTSGSEWSDVFQVGSRLERFVATYGPAKESLLERRRRAVANLTLDPRDAGSARLLFLITVGLRHDEALWREFPRLLPRDNPFWWEFTRFWINSTVVDKHFADVVAAVDLEKFFADGPEWVRAQLLQRRALNPGGPAATVVDWRSQLIRTGTNCVQALAATGQGDAALRVARAIMRLSSARETRQMVAGYLERGGAKAQADLLLREGSYGH